MTTDNRELDLAQLAREAVDRAVEECSNSGLLKVTALRHARMAAQKASDSPEVSSLLTLRPYVDAAIAETEHAGQAAEVEKLRDRVRKLERSESQLVDERDRAQEAADELADAVASLTGAEVGEHSNMNDPWANAIEAAREKVAELALAEMEKGRVHCPRYGCSVTKRYEAEMDAHVLEWHKDELEAELKRLNDAKEEWRRQAEAATEMIQQLRRELDEVYAAKRAVMDMASRANAAVRTVLLDALGQADDGQTPLLDTATALAEAFTAARAELVAAADGERGARS